MKRKAPFKKQPEDLNFREELGLKLEDVAPFCGVSVSMLGMIESDQRHWPWKANGNHQKLKMATYQSLQNPLDEAELPKP